MRRRVKIAVLLATAATALSAFAAASPVAAAAGCANQSNASAPAAAQERAMLCLVNRARTSRGLSPLASPRVLNQAADRKSGDMISCDEFSHEACGREFTYWIEQFGYDACRAGENIAWGSGSRGTPLSIFRAWMHSSGHRRNILGAFEDIGIGLRTGSIEGFSGARVWTQQFGTRC
jgi:uncharacterized protein YkwD